MTTLTNLMMIFCRYDKEYLTPVKPLSNTLVKPNIALAVKTAIPAGPVSVYINAEDFVFQSHKIMS